MPQGLGLRGWSCRTWGAVGVPDRPHEASEGKLWTLARGPPAGWPPAARFISRLVPAPESQVGWLLPAVSIVHCILRQWH